MYKRYSKNVYNEFCNTVDSEIRKKLSCKTIFMGGICSNKKCKNKKPWWNEGLNKLWIEMCEAEKT